MENHKSQQTPIGSVFGAASTAEIINLKQQVNPGGDIGYALVTIW